MSEFDRGATRRILKLEREMLKEKSFEYPLALLRANAAFKQLPGLRGFWSMAPYDEAGNTVDQSGIGRFLTYNGNPTYNVEGLAPYIDLDGTGDFLNRGDEAALDITGTETYVAPALRGLTVGGWFRPGNTNASFIIGKVSGAAGNRSYWLEQTPAQVDLSISVDGTAVTSVIGSAPVANQWIFIVGRFDPSTEMKLWQNLTETTNVAAIPASIFNGNSAFVIGANGAGGTLFTGRASFCFLCATAVPDATIRSLFRQSRVLFGV